MASNGRSITDEGFEEHCLELVIAVAINEEFGHPYIPYNYPNNDPTLSTCSTVDVRETRNIESKQCVQ